MKRHQNNKHPELIASAMQQIQAPKKPLTMMILRTILECCCSILHKDKCYSENIRNEFKHPPSTFAEELWDKCKGLFESLQKKGDPEKFYASFFPSVIPKAKDYFPSLTPASANLLAFKLADVLLIHFKESKMNEQTSENNSNIELNDKEKDSLQYLGGYVISNLFRKVKNSRHWKTSESQQMMAVLKAAKSDTVANQKLVNGLTRGGLWGIGHHAEFIFSAAEMKFRQHTAGCELHKIETKKILSEVVHDTDVASNYNSLLGETEMLVNSDVAKNTLQSIIELYLKVRSFSYAKDIVQKYKQNEHKSRSKALRKKIKRASSKPNIEQ